MTPFSRNQTVRLHTAGTVSLPPHFPELGILSLIAPEMEGVGAVLRIEGHVSRFQLEKFLVRSHDLSAILIAVKGKLDPKTDIWLIGTDAAELNVSDDARADDGNIYGIAFVREPVGVLAQVDRAVTAGELQDGGYPGCCVARGGGCC